MLNSSVHHSALFNTHHRVSLRGMCVLLPRTLPRLTQEQVWAKTGHQDSDKGRSCARLLSPTPTIPPARKGHLRLHRQILPPSLHISDSAAASVFRAVRLRGPVGRDVIAGITSLSIATVNRQVIALLDAGLLRERADLAVSGAIGRPGCRWRSTTSRS